MIFWKKISHFLKKVWQFSHASTAKFCYMIRFFGNFPETLGMSGSLENWETIQKLHQVVCGSSCIIFFLKSRPIYVNVDSPNLGFPYINFLGGYQLKKTPRIITVTVSSSASSDLSQSNPVRRVVVSVHHIHHLRQNIPATSLNSRSKFVGPVRSSLHL